MRPGSPPGIPNSQRPLPPLQGCSPCQKMPHVRVQLPLLSHHPDHILVYVDDTLILFSKKEEHLGTLMSSFGKHYEVTLNRDATNFLGLNFTHNTDGTITVTQPKLLQKLFALHPPRTHPTKSTRSTPTHPYAPLPKDADPEPQPTDHYTYLRLLGMLLYLSKSRPDIMAAVSFADTKSRSPTDKDLSD